MNPEELFNKDEFKKRAQNMDLEDISLCIHMGDRIKGFLMRMGGRRGMAILQSMFPWIVLPLVESKNPGRKVANPEIPHKDLQLHHLASLRTFLDSLYQEKLNKLRSDLDTDSDI